MRASSVASSQLVPNHASNGRGFADQKGSNVHAHQIFDFRTQEDPAGWTRDVSRPMCMCVTFVLLIYIIPWLFFNNTKARRYHVRRLGFRNILYQYYTSIYIPSYEGAVYKIPKVWIWKWYGYLRRYSMSRSNKVSIWVLYVWYKSNCTFRTYLRSVSNKKSLTKRAKKLYIWSYMEIWVKYEYEI